MREWLRGDPFLLPTRHASQFDKLTVPSHVEGHVTHHEDFMTVPVSYYLALSVTVFLTGVTGVLIRRNIIAILLSIELMLNATNINFVAFSEHLRDLGGQVFVFFALTVAAAEVAIGLAIIIALYR